MKHKLKRVHVPSFFIVIDGFFHWNKDHFEHLPHRWRHSKAKFSLSEHKISLSTLQMSGSMSGWAQSTRNTMQWAEGQIKDEQFNLVHILDHWYTPSSDKYKHRLFLEYLHSDRLERIQAWWLPRTLFSLLSLQSWWLLSLDARDSWSQSMQQLGKFYLVVSKSIQIRVHYIYRLHRSRSLDRCKLWQYSVLRMPTSNIVVPLSLWFAIGNCVTLLPIRQWLYFGHQDCDRPYTSDNASTM